MSARTHSNDTPEPTEKAHPAADTGSSVGRAGGSATRTAFIVGGVIALTAVLLVAAGFIFGWFVQPQYPTTTAPAEPNSRYEGTLHTEDGDQTLVIRFFEDGAVTLTSPDQQRHSNLVKVDDAQTQYREEILNGDGTPDALWVLSIDGSDTLTVVREDTDGEFGATSPRGSCERTDWEATDGEDGLALTGPAAE